LKSTFKTRAGRLQSGSGERGYILISILFMVTILIISLAIAVPSLKTAIKREREEELIHRGKQYTRAIQLYYRKFGRYPTSVDQLESTNTLRFLRRKYKDPIIGTDEWKLIRFGQAHAKPLPPYLKGATPAGNLGGSTGGIGVGGAGAAGGTGTAGPGAGISNASDISKSLSGSPTLGGGPIVGVASTSEKEGLKEIDGKTKYSEWEFVYDPTLDRTGAAGGATGVPGGVQGGTNQNPGNPTGPGIGDQRPTRPPR
jgi:type II secretory pathway pseudopilin PulG